MSHLFITGTDTGVGKTYISLGLLRAFNKLGYSTLGIKPLASGCHDQDNHLYNDDALALQQTSSIHLPYTNINPFAFLPPIAPHLAAEQAGCLLTVNSIAKKIAPALQYPADLHLIEGIGGWQVPLNQHETMADLVTQQGWTVILVVGIRLGCLNHALLTQDAISKTKLVFAGWIANSIEPPDSATEGIVTTLRSWLRVPYLGQVGYQQPPEQGINLSAARGVMSPKV